MARSQFTYQAALQDFRDAHRQAALQEVLARLTGKSSRLLSFAEVARKLKLASRVERGVKPIPVNAIVGSTDRYADFTRTFLPRHSIDEQRWARVKMAFSETAEEEVPPIDVYKVGEAYFVLDGNHRVSVARQEGRSHIDAHVIEVQTNIPLTPDVQPEDLIVKAEYADFLEETRLADLRPNVDLSLTVPGQYDKLREEIEVQRYWLEEAQSRPVSFQEAVESWYDEVYTPVAEAIRDRGLLRGFPSRTETDLYLWVTDHREALQTELGWAIRPEAAVTDLVAEKARGDWRQGKLFDRYTDRLFMDILVPLSGTPQGWTALEQAITIARREAAQLHGLHVVGSESQRSSVQALAIQARFNEECRAAGIPGRLAIETGDITRKIYERATLTDLVVLNVANPPGAGPAALQSGLRTIIERSARPVLALPGHPSSLERALLAFDRSPKAKAALFVATYMAERWNTALTVLTLRDPSRGGPSELEYAREYLELHEVEADYVLCDGPIDVLFEVMQERSIDLALMGGYGGSALTQALFGSTVNHMLRESCCPLFICR